MSGANKKGPQELALLMDPQENSFTQSIPQSTENIPLVRAFRPWSNVSSFKGKANDLRLLAKCMKICIKAGVIK